MRRRLLLALMLAALTVAGCGGDDGPGTSSSASSAASAPATAAPAGGEGLEIGMKDLTFVPKDVTVKVGTTITWRNLEEIPHNVVAEEGADFESDTFGRDGTYTFEAEKAGTVKYVCTIHPGMEGTLSVEG